MRPFGPSILCAAILTTAPSWDVVAQTVHGTVVDDVFSQPVDRASVLLLTADGSVRRGTFTDSSGTYSLPAGTPGIYSLRIDADGYTSLVSPPFVVESEQDLEIELRIALQSATPLEPVTVTGEVEPFTHGPLRDFYERKERGFGRFVTREDIEATMPMRFTDALRMTPGVRVIRMPFDKERPFGPGGRHHTVRIVGITRALGGDCPPLLYLDGTKMGPIDDATDGGPDLLIHPSSVEGIEVYRPSYVPAEYSGTDAMCGVIVVWSKRTP